MGEALHNLGIDGGAMIAQLVNFGLLFLILWKFLYKPILKMLNNRTATIEDSLAKAAEIDKEYQEIEKRKEKLVMKAKAEADKIIDGAKAEAKEIEKNATFEAETKAKTIIADAEVDAEKQKLAIIESAKDDVAKLVEQSLTSLLKNDTKKYDDALINEALAGFIEKG